MAYHINREQYFAQLRKNAEVGLEIMKRKNHDYAGDSDPFQNFRAAEALGISAEQGILVRMSDKMARIANLLKMKDCEQEDARGSLVTEESIEDTLIDLMNYSNILVAYLKLKEVAISKNRGRVFDGEVLNKPWREGEAVKCCTEHC